jgi:hypothetical protein
VEYGDGLEELQEALKNIWHSITKALNNATFSATGNLKLTFPQHV